MTRPLKLLVTFGPDGQAVEQMVPLSAEEVAQLKADQAAAKAAAAELVAADKARDKLIGKLEAGKASPEEQQQALALCLRETFGRAA